MGSGAGRLYGGFDEGPILAERVDTNVALFDGLFDSTLDNAQKIFDFLDDNVLTDIDNEAKFLLLDGGNSPTANIDWGEFDITNVNHIYADRFRSPLQSSAFIDWNAQGHLFMQAAGIELSVFSGEIDMQSNVDMNSNDILAANDITATGAIDGGDLKVSGTSISSTIVGSSGASLIGIAIGSGSPTVNQVQEYLDNTGSSGFFIGGELSDGGSGTLNVAAGEGFIRTTNDDNAPLLSFKWSASSGIAVPNDTTQYVYVDDTGAISLSTDEFLEAPDKIQIGVVTDEAGSSIHTFQLGVRLEESIGAAGRFIRRVHGIARNNRLGGLIFGQSGDANRDVTMTAGQLEWGRTTYVITSFDTSGADTFSTYSASGQENAAASQWDNDNYDNDGTLTSLGTNKWANLFFFIEPDNHIVMIYGRSQFTSQARAEGEGVPSTSLPSRVTETSILVARFVFKKGDNFAVISSAFDTLFANAGVTDHGNLAGLSDDDHVQYLLADGSRAMSGALNMDSNAITGAGAGHDQFSDFVTGEHTDHALSLDSDLIMWLRMDDITGSTVFDLTANGNDGTLQSGAVQVDGLIGKSVLLDGVDDRILVGNSVSLDENFTAFGISIWVKPNFTQINANHERVIDKDNDIGLAFRMFYVGSFKNWRFQITTNVGTKNCDTAGLTWDANTWHHIVVTYDGTDMKIYWDGVIAKTEPHTGTIINGEADLFIGIEKTLGSAFGGEIDDVMIFKRNISAAEAKELYELGSLDSTTSFNKAYFKEYIASRSGFFNHASVLKDLDVGVDLKVGRNTNIGGGLTVGGNTAIVGTLNVNEDVFFDGDLTADSGIAIFDVLTFDSSDPKVIGWNPTSRDYVKSWAEKIMAYSGGVGIFFNSDTRCFEIFEPSTGKFYKDRCLTDLEVVEQVEPIINADVEPYYKWDKVLGKSVLRYKPLMNNLIRIPEGMELDKNTGKLNTRHVEEISEL